MVRSGPPGTGLGAGVDDGLGDGLDDGLGDGLGEARLTVTSGIYVDDVRFMLLVAPERGVAASTITTQTAMVAKSWATVR